MNIIEKIFFDGFPREMGDHRWVAKNKEDAIRWIKDNQYHVNCYISIYSFNSFNPKNNRPIYETANVSYIYIDIDNDDGNANKYMKILHEHLLSADIAHWIMFSGSGYHFYIFCIPTSNTAANFSVSEAISNYQNHLENLLKIKICSSCKGNLSKVSRIPNTYHIKQKRHAIPIIDPYADHIELSSRPQWNIKIFGSNLINLKLWKPRPISDPIEIPTVEISGIDFSPCIEKIVKMENPGFEMRMALASYLNEYLRFGSETISSEDVSVITSKITDFIESCKWKKFSRYKTKTYVRWLVKGLSKGYSCNKLSALGLCSKCGQV